MNYNSIYIIFLILGLSCFGQEEYNLNGYIIDQQTGEALIGANIYNQASKTGTTSNAYGYFSINTLQGKNLFICSYVGYINDTLEIDINSNITHNFHLNVQNKNLEEVILRSESSNIKSIQNSVVNLPVKQVKELPTLLGEGDVLKAIQLLPGVQSGNEGTSGFYVRGGGPDQNLILLDGVPVYNSSHLLGFFSIFNEDVIKNINLTKGGFPARFGGRLSSVLEINTKDGNMKQWQVEGGVGLISGKITIQGPIKKDKTSIIIAGRRTWIDLFKKPIVGALENHIEFKGGGNYYFYDINAKINHKFSDKNRLYFSIYSGKDQFLANIKEEEVQVNEAQSWSETGSHRLTDNIISTTTFNAATNFGLSWNNFTTAIRWNYVINHKLFTNTTLLYSSYKFDNAIGTQNNITEVFVKNSELDTEINQESDYLYQSGLEDIGFKTDIDYFLNAKNHIKTGLSYIKHNFLPGKIDLFSTYIENEKDTTMIFSETTKPENIILYIEDLYTINNRLSVNLGLHYNIYQVNKKKYHDLQPRLSCRWLINEKSALKLSYATMQQNIHLLTNSSLGLPNDIWVPSTDIVNPQKSQQSALGYYINFNKGSIGNWLNFEKNNFEASVELYYKQMQNLVTFSEGTHILGTNFSSWEDRVEQNGNGIAQGIELFLQKKTGKLTGWIGYTLSKSTRQFEDINLGEEYPYKFDRRHDLSIVSSYKINQNISIHTTFVYGSGNAITTPIAKYLMLHGNDLREYYDYGDKNQFRMNPYHRLDIGCDFTKKTKWGERIWTVSIYNIYNRKNPFFIYLQEDGVEESGPYQYITRKPLQVSLFPIIPSISYSFKF